MEVGESRPEVFYRLYVASRTFIATVNTDDYKYAAKCDWTSLFDLQMHLFNLNLRGAAIRREKCDHYIS